MKRMEFYGVAHLLRLLLRFLQFWKGVSYSPAHAPKPAAYNDFVYSIMILL